MHYVYILHLSSNKFYTGFTSDLKRRLAEHKYGNVESTRHFRPVKLVLYEAYHIESDARRREKFLKTSEGKKLLKLQLRDYIYGQVRPSHTAGRPVG